MAGLPTVVIDDGSDIETLQRLDELVNQFDWVELTKQQTNKGKGAALLAGMRFLRNNGYTHAISIDADGQHDPADIQKLKQESERHPNALISGIPIYGEDIPAVRLYGRMITNKLAQLAALSSAIEDAMCGFRVYPINYVLALSDSMSNRMRMEFETEILVRACWYDMELSYVSTKVVYPDDGESHFRMVLDNIRLAIMHIILITRGVFGLPWRKWSKSRKISKILEKQDKNYP